MISLFVLLMASSCQPDLTEARSSPGSDSKLRWGFYQMLTRRSSWTEQIDVVMDRLGGDPSFVLFFRDLSPRRGFPLSQVRDAHARGLTPIISLELDTWGPGSDEDLLSSIANGDYDDYFRRWAEEAKGSGLEAILRFGFEMNGDWFAWGQQPRLFKAAWIRAKTLFQEAGCANVKWMFSPNVLWDGKSAKAALDPYYPGDEYVDYVGLDGYNFGDGHDRWHRWESYEEIFERSIKACQKFGKPLFISEIGCADDPRKTAWLRDFLFKVSRDDRIEGFVYFHHHNPRKGEPDWRIDSDSASLAVFREWTATSSEPR